MRVFSGIRPTGDLHLGNYLGAMNQWIEMTRSSVFEQARFLFCIVDQHALTTREDAVGLRESTLTIAAAYVACGLLSKNVSLFVQSHVPYHTELAWYLGCMTPLGWLNRMTQFKDKALKQKEGGFLGLYAYPVLMASDILLYQSTHVPVGEDQKQHVELARDIALSFNHQLGDIFTVPQPTLSPVSGRIMSLREGRQKMSKSDPSAYSRIHLLDDADTITLKIRKAKTDGLPIPGSVEDLLERPEIKNLLQIYATFTKKTLSEACLEWEDKPFSIFKARLSDCIIEHLSPIRQEMIHLLKDEIHLQAILNQGAAEARDQAQKTINTVRSTLQFL